MERFGTQLAHAMSTRRCLIYLIGELGAGKTTLARGFLRGMGYQDRVKSPTYTIVESYTLINQNVYHFDLYRMENASSLYEIGIEDYLSDQAICLVEWPEHGQAVLPAADIVIHISVLPVGREIEIQAAEKLGQEIMERLLHASEN